jgi:alkaline phosphatase
MYKIIKKQTLLLVALLMTVSMFARQAKYVFYFIGDGMGLAQVNNTEYYLSQKEGKLGTTPLCFASFPYTGFANTFSANSNVTDSSAAGTALASGHKTNNGMMGQLPDGSPVLSVATWAKAAGHRVGITTNVGINHATPAAFYAHRPSRNDYYEIGVQLAESGFDFFGSGDFINATPADKTSLYDVAEEHGYVIARGKADYDAKKNNAKKMILFFDRPTSGSMPLSLDAKEGELNQKEITECAIDFLMKKNRKGFFLMVEGGMIDQAGHANDAASNIHEVLALDEAVKVAYDFYKKHKNETLIVITSDHETGGLSLNGSTVGRLAHQKCSMQGFSRVLNALRHEKKDKVAWEDVKAALQEHFGFWTELRMSHEDEMALYEEWYQSFASNREVKMAESLYFRDEPLSALAVRILNRQAGIGWTTGGHSGIAVPVFAIGVGAEQFTGQYDNTEICKKIAKAAGYKMK